MGAEICLKSNGRALRLRACPRRTCQLVRPAAVRTPIRDTTGSRRLTASPEPSWKRAAGHTRANRSSPSPTSRRVPKAEDKAQAPTSPLALEAVRRTGCPVRDRARHQWESRGTAPDCPPGTERAAGRRSRSLDGGGAPQDPAWKRCRQSHDCPSAGRPFRAAFTTDACAS
jgi:hypothetical protein